jgi:hypothetical protein
VVSTSQGWTRKPWILGARYPETTEYNFWI